MITVAIIGILVAVALAFYNDYATRTKIAAGLRLASPIITRVTESYLTNNANGVISYQVPSWNLPVESINILT